MSEAPTGVINELSQIKREIVDPRTISLRHDKEGRRGVLESAVGAKTNLQDVQMDITKKEQKIQQIAELTSSSAEQERQKVLQLTLRMETLVVKVKKAFGVNDKEAEGLQTEIDTLRSERDSLRADSSSVEADLEALKQGRTEIPKPNELLKAYYEKMLTMPLSNEQKRDLLKPEVLSSLSTEEYIALWKRLNPYFLSHVTRQGFRDHNAMFYHSAGLQEFHNGFVNLAKDEKQLRPPLALHGLKKRDEVSVKMFLNDWVLQAENEDEAKKRFDNLLHWSLASAPTYPDRTAVHFSGQKVSNAFYGGERNNEVFFLFPSDVIASQHDFAFNWKGGNFIEPTAVGEDQWNDVFVWPNSLEDPGITIDAGIVFLPEKTRVDPDTGSKYVSEVKTVDGKEQRVMIENTEIKDKFIEWTKRLGEESLVIQMAHNYYNERSYDREQALSADFNRLLDQELQKIGFDQDASAALIPDLRGDLIFWNKDVPIEKFQELINGSSGKYRRAENTVPAKDYWEDFFSKNPNLRPKHIVYYDGSPTSAIYRFQQENGIGSANTSKTEGQLLGFDDHHIIDVENDPRSNQGHKELVDLGNKIIAEHYRNKI